MNIQKKMKGIKTNPTKEYKIVTIIISFFLVVFLTSKMWLPDADKIQSTAVGVTQRVSPITEITLSSWEYNPLTQFMEVIVSVSDDKNFGRTEFNVTAKISQNKSLPAEIIIKENSMMIIHINKIPKNFKVVSLWIEQKTEDGSKGKNNDKVNFKCDYRQVAVENELQSKTKHQYVLQSIDNEINTVNEKIDEINQLITDKQNQIKMNADDIEILKKEIKYQTQDEIKNTDKAIERKLQDSESLKVQIENEKKNISSLNEKLNKLQLKLADAKKEQHT